MDIKILWSVDNDNSPVQGIAGITDVVAATYNIILLLSKTNDLYIVRDNKSAFDALKKFPGALLIGESTEPGLPFVASNSPIAINKVDITGKTVILKTNNGTVAVAEAYSRGARQVFAFHWANLRTIAKWIQRQNLTEVVLLASGGREEVFRRVNGHLMEDWYCCEALQELLLGKNVNYEKYFAMTRKSIKEQYPSGDPSNATRDLVLRTEKEYKFIVPFFSELTEGIFKVSNAHLS